MAKNKQKKKVNKKRVKIWLEKVKKFDKKLIPKALAKKRRLVQITNKTPAEAHIMNLLKKTDHLFDYQYTIFFGDFQFYILDFYLPKYKLCIELDGSHHYTDEKQIQHDELRTMRLFNKGIKTIRIPNKEALEHSLETFELYLKEHL